MQTLMREVSEKHKNEMKLPSQYRLKLFGKMASRTLGEAGFPSSETQEQQQLPKPGLRNSIVPSLDQMKCSFLNKNDSKELKVSQTLGASHFFKPESFCFNSSPKQIRTGSRKNDLGETDPLVSSLMESRSLVRPSTSRVQSKAHFA